jgi:hypothetical protein
LQFVRWPTVRAQPATVASRREVAALGRAMRDGNKLTHHVIASWLPEWIGTDQTRYVEVEGNKLMIKTAVLKIPSAAAREYVATVAFERVE